MADQIALVSGADTIPAAQAAPTNFLPTPQATPAPQATPNADAPLTEDAFLVTPATPESPQPQQVVPANGMTYPLGAPVQAVPPQPAVAPMVAPMVAPVQPTVDPALAASMQEMRAELAAMRESQTQTPAQVEAAPELALTAEEQTTFAQSLPLMQKVSSHAASVAAHNLKQEIEAVRRENETARNELAGQLSQVGARTYEQTLVAAVPDLNSLTAHPSFEIFKQNMVPYSNETVGTRLATAHKSGDVGTVQSILSSFRQQVTQPNMNTLPAQNLGQPAPQQQAAPAANALGAFVQPSTVQNTNMDGVNPDQPTPPVRMLALSKRVEAENQRNAGVITAERFDQIADLYVKADMEGRVDYNA